MDTVCTECKGRGQWQEQVSDATGNVYIVQKYCETCHGTGINDAGEDFDFGGDDESED